MVPLWTVNVRVGLLLPTATLPNTALAGVTVRPPVAAIPVPLKGTVKGPAELLRFSVPLTGPGAVGANAAVKVQDAPEFSMGSPFTRCQVPG